MAAAMSLSPAVEASYVSIIDSILAASDINTITSKRIREGLQQAVNYDITPQKNVIKTLIMQRFDKFVAEKNQPSAPATNGHSETFPPSPVPPTHHDLRAPASPSNPLKRRSPSDSAGHPSPLTSPAAAAASPIAPPKKRKSSPLVVVDDDAAFAARLQAEENRRAGRATRNAAAGRKVTPSKKKTPIKKKRKTADRVGVDDDSDLEDGDERKINRSGGFHKPLTLSAPLSALLDGEIALSRPQTVKRIWEYVKINNLQDPKDKRQIRCDDAMRAVFKTDKVHMFTMNKILGQNLYAPDE